MISERVDIRSEVDYPDGRRPSGECNSIPRTQRLFRGPHVRSVSVPVDGSVHQLAQSDSSRYYLAILVQPLTGGQQCFVSPTRASALLGLGYEPGDTPQTGLVLEYCCAGVLVCSDWWARSIGGGGSPPPATITVIEAWYKG